MTLEIVTLVFYYLVVIAGAVHCLSDRDLSEELVALWTAEQAMAARRLVIIREIEGRDMARREGAVNVATWLRDKLRITIGSARRDLKLAQVLDSTCEATSAALAAGVVNEQQARVIAQAVTDLAEYGPVVQGKAEQVLLHEDCVLLEPGSLRAAAE